MEDLNRRAMIGATTAGILSAVGGTLPAKGGSQKLQRPDQRDYRTWPGYEEGTAQVPVRKPDGTMAWMGIAQCE